MDGSAADAATRDAGPPCQSDADCFGDRPYCDIPKHVCVMEPPLTPIRPAACDCGLAPDVTSSPLPAITFLAAVALFLVARRRL